MAGIGQMRAYDTKSGAEQPWPPKKEDEGKPPVNLRRDSPGEMRATDPKTGSRVQWPPSGDQESQPPTNLRRDTGTPSYERGGSVRPKPAPRPGIRAFAAGGSIQPISFRGGRSFRPSQFQGFTGPAAESAPVGSAALTSGDATQEPSNPYFDRGVSEQGTVGVSRDSEGRATGANPQTGALSTSVQAGQQQTVVDNSWDGVKNAAMNTVAFAGSPLATAAKALGDMALGRNQSRISSFNSIARELIGGTPLSSDDKTIDPKTGVGYGEKNLGINREVKSEPLAPPTSGPGGADPSNPGASGPPTSMGEAAVSAAKGDAVGAALGASAATPGVEGAAGAGSNSGAQSSGANATSEAKSEATGVGGGLFGGGGQVPGEPGQPVPITAHAEEYVLPVPFLEALQQLLGLNSLDEVKEMLDEAVRKATGQEPVNGKFDQGGDMGDDASAPPQPGMGSPPPPAAPRGPGIASMRAGAPPAPSPQMRDRVHNQPAGGGRPPFPPR